MNQSPPKIDMVNVLLYFNDNFNVYFILHLQSGKKKPYSLSAYIPMWGMGEDRDGSSGGGPWL
ncbi:MAG: hypothetical protein A3F41_00375 [Coxiella sp. RIFCSPHIGHO2_12_FULL_44_14]|nr:MAG: hypothetical protein A3F41_00375 [Coxiella sp. RIFCSPHIGHO2_12_FULL_44_14]